MKYKSEADRYKCTAGKLVVAERYIVALGRLHRITVCAVSLIAELYCIV